MLQLTPRSSCSYTCTDLDAFAVWLEDHGFRRIATRYQRTEYGRWERSLRICVVFFSGAVLMQGPQIAPALALLAELVPTEQRREAVQV